MSESRPQLKSVGLWQAGLLHGGRPSSAFPSCTRSPDLTSSLRHFSMLATCLRSDVCHLQAPKQMGAQGEARAWTKPHIQERRMLLRVCFTTFWCHIKHKNSRYEMRETFFEECLRVLLRSSPRNINYTSYAKPSAKGGVQNRCMQSSGPGWQRELYMAQLVFLVFKDRNTFQTFCFHLPQTA